MGKCVVLNCYITVNNCLSNTYYKYVTVIHKIQECICRSIHVCQVELPNEELKPAYVGRYTLVFFDRVLSHDTVRRL